MSHSYRVSPQSLQTAGPCNIYVQPSTKADCPVMSNGDSRRRYNGTHTHRRDSLLTGLRNLMTRPRSESLNSQMMNRPKKPLLKVQVSGCQLESVYDLREDKGEESDLYDDQWAFRRPRSNSSDFLILRKTSRPLSVDVVGLVDAQSDPYRQYMKVVDCYELAPSAGNIITLDKNIQVDRAFTALCENNVGAGLVWDSELSKVTSIVTLTDFLGLLQTENATSSNKTVSSIMQTDALITISADNKILEACEDFCMNHVHRLVVTEPVSGDVLYLLTIKRILQAIHKQNRSLHFAQWLSCPIKESEVGTWTEKIHTIAGTATVSEAISQMLYLRVSSLPIVDKNGRGIDVLLKSDLAQTLWKMKEDHRDTFLSSEVSHMTKHRQPTAFLHANDSVGKVLDALLLSHHTRSVFIVDAHSGYPTACVSQSDIISHLIHEEAPFQKTIDISKKHQTPQGSPDIKAPQNTPV